MSSSVLVINDGEFKSEVLNATKPVLVYFWASWCGPCRLVSPSINWAAETYADRLKVVKMEVDPNPLSVKEYQVEGVPAFRLFKGNDVILSHEGAITREKMASLIEPYL
ncbi:MAG TPA: thioredoxin family protein [Halomicronema sp.]